MMAGLRSGGGWVSIPITKGTGTLATLPIPTLGLTLSGCVRVWDGHSGQWSIRAVDTIGLDSLRSSAAPGEGVRFSHGFGLRARLEFEFRWSEPRDTTLFLWVGLDRADKDRDPCMPVAPGTSGGQPPRSTPGTVHRPSPARAQPCVPTSSCSRPFF
jgi:hypothetical protein